MCAALFVALRRALHRSPALLAFAMLLSTPRTNSPSKPPVPRLLRRLRRRSRLLERGDPRTASLSLDVSVAEESDGYCLASSACMRSAWRSNLCFTRDRGDVGGAAMVLGST